MFRTQLWRRHTAFRRFFCSDQRFASAHQAAKFLAQLLDLNEAATLKCLNKNEFLMNLEQDDTVRKIKYLKYLNASGSDILEHAHLLFLNLLTLENRATILRESGFVESLSLPILSKYLTIVRQNVKTLKFNRFIPAELNMFEQIKKQFDVTVCPKIKKNHDDMQLQELRKVFLIEFLKIRLHLTETENAKLWKTYWKVKHRSFGHIQRVLDILQNEYNFGRDKIIGNFYLLYADSENLLRYPEVVPNIAETSIKEIIMRHPKIATIQCEKVRDLLNELREHKINEEGIVKYPIMLTLSLDTIRIRINELQKNKEFAVYFNHPRITKLIAYQTKAAIRLDFLRQLKVRCASLNVLFGHSKNFERYVRGGNDQVNGKDTWYYLKTIFKKQGKEAMNQLKLHPNWYHVPVVQLRNTFDYLTNEGFATASIYENIQILLYPRLRIESKLQRLLNCQKLRIQHDEMGIELTSATPSQVLSLCLYLIEVDFHFSGNGVWPEENQQSDATTITNIKLPNTLHSMYKYGKKPAGLVGHL